MISAKVIAYSVAPTNDEIITFEVRFPYCILQQVRTYGMLSYSVRSLRAVPTEKLIKEVRENPYIPQVYAERVKGMQPGAPLPPEVQEKLKELHGYAAQDAADAVEEMLPYKPAKESVNRILAPYLWADAVITGTRNEMMWMINQRMKEDVQSEFQQLAEKMKFAWNESQAVSLKRGGWHLPYIDTQLEYYLNMEVIEIASISAARCARVSYKPFDGNDSVEAELQRATTLINAPHLSPFEHQAMATTVSRHHGKLRGFMSYRTWIGY